MFWPAMDLQLGGKAARFSRGERFIRRSEGLRVLIVHYQVNLRCLRKMDVDRVAQAVGKVNHRAARCHLDMTPGLRRRAEQKEGAGAVAFVPAVIPGHRGRSGRQRQTALLGQLFAALSRADGGPLGILRPMIDRKLISVGQTNPALAVCGKRQLSFSRGLSSFLCASRAPSGAK